MICSGIVYRFINYFYSVFYDNERLFTICIQSPVFSVYYIYSDDSKKRNVPKNGRTKKKEP